MQSKPRAVGLPARVRTALRMAALILCMEPTTVRGYLSSYPSYDSMAAKADLVVIATPLSRQEQNGEARLPGVRQGPNGDPVPAVEIETTFSTLAVLKGDAKLTGGVFTLVHYIEKVKDSSGFVTAGPMLIDFKAGDGSTYLMFLKSRRDGRFEAYDEVEPGWCILKLPHGAGALP
jgi:hypothetical protein